MTGAHQPAELDLFETAFYGAPIGMAMVGLDGSWLRVNPALCELLGYSADELLGLTFQDITHAEDLGLDLSLVAETIAGTRAGYHMQKRYVRSDGRVIGALLSVALVRDAGGAPRHFISHVQDISDRLVMENRLRQWAERDALTGLFNRRRLVEALTQQIGRCERYDERATLAMIDLDGFKAVNDLHGHVAGDGVLCAVGEALAGRLRLSDTLARLGGDEFAALLPGVAAAGHWTLEESLAGAVASASSSIRVSASIGLTELVGGDDPLSVLSRADRAMYAAKRRRLSGERTA